MTPEQVLSLALQITLPSEGGYVFDGRDPGGKTNMGITQSTYSNWLKEHSMPDSDVRTITVQEVHSIYDELFWQKPHFDLIASVVPACSIAVFDWYLNGGAKMEQAAIQSLQRRLGVVADGEIGPNTATAAASVTSDLTLALKLCDDRQAYDDVHTGAAFIHGITNRIEAMKEFLQQHFGQDEQC